MVQKDGLGWVFTAAPGYSPWPVNEVLFTKSEHKEQRIIPALIKTVEEEGNIAGRDFESLSGFSSYLNLWSAAPDIMQEDGQRPAVLGISESLSGNSLYLTGLVSW